VSAISAGFFQEEIARSAYEHQLRVESGATTIVGVNRFADSSESPAIPAPDYTMLERGQVEALASLRSNRNAEAASAALRALGDAASKFQIAEQGTVRMMPLIIDAVRARCTVGEISGALLEHWGAYTPSMQAAGL
jgi:methylmalonyl-CoA mutase, N-terminal domain